MYIFVRGILYVLHLSALISANLQNTVNFTHWSESVINVSSMAITSSFGRNYCLQVIADLYMYDLLLQTSITTIPVFNVGTRKTKCRNFLIAYKDVKDIQNLLGNSLLPQEAKYLLLTTTRKSANFLYANLMNGFFLDITLIEVTKKQVMSPPKQLGVVVGNNGRVNLHGRTLVIVGVRNPPFAVYEPEKKVKLNGVEVRVIRELSDAMNFQKRVHEPFDKQGFGRRNETGHWTGLKGELASGKSDIGFALLYLTWEHHITFQMSTPYTQVCLSFLVPAPTKLLGHWLALLRPLKLTTWFTFMSIAAVHVIIYQIITRNSLVTCILETVRGAALVSGPQPKGPVSQRILFVTWLLGSFLVAGLYSSELSAWMVSQITKSPLRTLQDLASSDVTWGSLDTYVVDYLEKSPSIVSSELIRKFQIENSNEDIEKKVLRGKYAVVVNILSDGYPTGAEFLSPKARKMLVALPECVVSHYIVLGMRRGLPLIRATNLEIMRLQEAGLFQEWQARDVKTYGDGADYKNLKTTQEAVLPLNLNNLTGAFAFWMLSLALACLMFVYENIIARFKIVYHPNKIIRHRTPVLMRRK